MRREQLFEQTIRGIAGDADLPQHAAEHVDEQRIRIAVERDAELEFWRGHETRFYSERRSNSTRAREQSAAI